METGQSEQDVELSIAEAELNLLKARQELDDIYASAEMDAALALQAVEAAENALENLLDTELQQAQALQAIAEAEETVAEAQRNYNSVRAQASQSVIDAAYADLVLAENQLKDAQKKFNEYADKPDENLVKDKLQQLPIGLNASVEVIAGQAMNALLVPIEAIYELEDVSTVVYVLTGDELEKRRVSVGLMYFTSAEILEGLEVGEIVAIGNVER